MEHGIVHGISQQVVPVGVAGSIYFELLGCGPLQWWKAGSLMEALEVVWR
jgi:hypothetical protein